MASSLEDLAGIWEAILENPTLSNFEVDALERFCDAKEREFHSGLNH